MNLFFGINMNLFLLIICDKNNFCLFLKSANFNEYFALMLLLTLDIIYIYDFQLNNNYHLY